MVEPVLIVGAGPVGLIVALELAHHGVKSLLIDRATQPTQFPKMDITNGRSMELFRRLGFTEKLRVAGVASQHSFDCLFALPDGSPPFGKWALPSVDDQRRFWSPRNDGSAPLEADQRVPQSAFEAMARDLCRAAPLIDFREGFAFEAIDQDTNGVDLTFSNVGNGKRETVRGCYLVGCDGAGSRIRGRLGIMSDEAPTMPQNYMIHFRSRDLAELHRHGQFWHYFVSGSVIIAQDEVDHWTFHAPMFDGPPAETPDPQTLIAERTGLRPVIDAVLLTSLWQPRFVLARSYGQGRVFLAGDAVHQVFPTGGYGMNTGVGDAIDIGWKIAAVVNGWAGPALLESYEAERRPVGARNRDYSQRHLGVHMGLGQATQGGASPADLQAYIEKNGGENELDGIEFGYRYTASPVVVHETGDEPRWSERDYVPSTWPGARPPSFILDDGSALFDLFGTELTLVDFRGDAAKLAEAALARGIPVTHLHVADAKVRAAWERELVLVRPDQHVAWRSDAMPDAATWYAVLDRVCGQENGARSTLSR